MQWLAQICVRRPVFATVLMLVIVVLGLVGYGRLGVDQFPNVDLPFVIVTTRLDGASPEEVETDITDKIEGAVNTIDGLDELRSTSGEGFSQVALAFKLEKNADVAAQEVRDKVNNVLRDLPKGIDPPIVSKVDPQSAPIMQISLRSKKPIREVTELADKRVRRQIESISGVGQVTLVGGRSRQIHVWINPVALKAQNLSPVDVSRALASQNLTTPGGTIETGPQSITLKIEGRVDTIDAIERIVVREQGGHTVRIADVARVEDGQEEVKSIATYDGERTLMLSVRKQSGTNTVAVVDQVLKQLGEIKKTLPPGVELEVVRDNSKSVRTGLDAVKEHLAIGAVLAALVVLMFLGNARSTLIAAVSIPISIIGTFALMWIQGFSLNMMTLLALALAVGIVIDDAIVVLENITRFVEEKQQKPFPAAVLATREIGLAVLATTLSLMAVFIPVAFVGGIPGRFLKNFGYTMAFAVGVSLLVSFTLTPTLSARMLKGHVHDAKPSILLRVVDTFYRPIERVYMAILRFSMKRRWVVVIACGLTLGSCVPLAKKVPGGFLPIDDQAQFEVSIRAPEGTSSEETALVAERVAQDVRKLPGVNHTVVTVADGDQQIQNLGTVYVALTEPADRKLTQQQLQDMTRKQILAKLPPELRVSVGDVAAFSTGSSSANVQYVLAGPDLAKLEEITAKMAPMIKASPASVDFDTNLIVGKPELRVSIDRDRAADLGVSVADVADTLRMLVAGVKGSTFAEQGEEYDIRIRAAESYRRSKDSIALMTVPSRKFGTVPLSTVVRRASAPADTPVFFLHHIACYGLKTTSVPLPVFVTALLQQLRTNQLTLGETASALRSLAHIPDAVTLQQRVLSLMMSAVAASLTVFLSGRAWATIESARVYVPPGTPEAVTGQPATLLPLAIGMGLCLVAAAFVAGVYRGGFWLHALGLTVVTESGVIASRAQALARAIATWSWMPVGAPVSWNPHSRVPPVRTGRGGAATRSRSTGSCGPERCSQQRNAHPREVAVGGQRRRHVRWFRQSMPGRRAPADLPGDRVELGREPAVMFQQVVVPAQRRQVGLAGGAARRVRDDMVEVAIDGRSAAPGEGAPMPAAPDEGRHTRRWPVARIGRGASEADDLASRG